MSDTIPSLTANVSFNAVVDLFYIKVSFILTPTGEHWVGNLPFPQRPMPYITISPGLWLKYCIKPLHSLKKLVLVQFISN